jgi:hypothetical protein
MGSIGETAELSIVYLVSDNELQQDSGQILGIQVLGVVAQSTSWDGD